MARVIPNRLLKNACTRVPSPLREREGEGYER